ncbi:MAG: hypothetical protein M3Q97_10345, partial [Bacteroidota bacterium]|nr:hypothetical protein [Bacteroidota bacterium]
LEIEIRHFFIQQGRDSTNANFGGDLAKSYKGIASMRPYGHRLLQGVPSVTNLLELRVSYLFRYNLYFDLNFLYRSEKISDEFYNSTYIGAGARLNFFPSNYEF